jgi:hypothetical protein
MYKVLGADNNEYGPVDADQIRRWIADRRLNGDSSARLEGASEWRPLREFPEFSASLQQATPAPNFDHAAGHAAPPSRRNNPMGLAGFVMGILALMCCCCYGFPFHILGLVFSLIALSQIRRHPAEEGGEGFAWAGLVLSVISIVLGVVLYFWQSSIPQTQWEEWLEQLRKASQSGLFLAAAPCAWFQIGSPRRTAKPPPAP